MSNLVQLMSCWEDYAAQTKTPSVEDFAVWIITARDAKQAGWEGDRFKRNSEARQYAAHAGYLIGRLSRFARVYGKPVVQRYELNSMDDLGFLATIDRNKVVGKKELCDQSLIEFTTGIDIIKRLKKLSYIREQVNPKDKREKLLSITDAGKKVLTAIFTDLLELPDLLVDLSLKDRKTIVDWLQRLDQFHSKTYKNIIGNDPVKG